MVDHSESMIPERRFMVAGTPHTQRRIAEPQPLAPGGPHVFTSLRCNSDLHSFHLKTSTCSSAEASFRTSFSVADIAVACWPYSRRTHSVEFSPKRGAADTRSPLCRRCRLRKIQTVQCVMEPVAEDEGIGLLRCLPQTNSTVSR